MVVVSIIGKGNLNNAQVVVYKTVYNPYSIQLNNQFDT
jgi:hypothetical protein